MDAFAWLPSFSTAHLINLPDGARNREGTGLSAGLARADHDGGLAPKEVPAQTALIRLYWQARLALVGATEVPASEVPVDATSTLAAAPASLAAGSSLQ